MESRAISPSKTALPHAYALLAPSEAMEERRSGAGARWCVCVVVQVVGGDVAADMPRLAETARSLGREAGMSEKTSGAARG